MGVNEKKCKWNSRSPKSLSNQGNAQCTSGFPLPCEQTLIAGRIVKVPKHNEIYHNGHSRF